MLATLLIAFLAMQGGGTITGIIRTPDGRPVMGVRVSALAKPDAPQEGLSNSAMAAIAATDEEGRYRLEDIPPGQYYVIAGSVDLPTYYPGTPQMASGTLVKVSSGAVLAGYDFSMGDNSVRSERTDIFREPSGPRQMSTRVVADDGGRIPVSSANGPVRIHFERTVDGTETVVPISATIANLQFLLAQPVTEFAVEVQNLPEGYAVKSIQYGTTDITADKTIRMPATTPIRASMKAGTPSPVFAAPLVDNLTITLASTPMKVSGVRVTGASRLRAARPIFMSGTQGIIFSDGTFEFRNVPPGRHTIATIDAPGRARGTTVVVGESDLESITLIEISDVPISVQTPTPPAPSGGKPAGTIFPPVTLRAHVVDEGGKAAPDDGQVLIGGNLQTSLDAEGKFVIPGLLPGVYYVEIQMFGFKTINQNITVGVEDLALDIPARKL